MDARGAYEVALAAVAGGGPGSAEVRAARPEHDSRNAGWVLIALENTFHQLLHAPSF